MRDLPSVYVQEIIFALKAVIHIKFEINLQPLDEIYIVYLVKGSTIFQIFKKNRNTFTNWKLTFFVRMSVKPSYTIMTFTQCSKSENTLR